MFLHFRNVIPKLTPPQGFGDRGWFSHPGNADPNEPLGLYAVQDDVEVHLRSSQGILESWPERWTSSWCLDPWYLWLFFMPHVHLTQSILTFCLVLSLSLCIYISPHVFDSNGWFISIHKSCLWECSIHLTDICETLLLMFCQDMIGHLFHLCIETFGLPADVDSQPLDVTLFRTANITRWPGYKRNISYKTYINHICFFFN